VSVAAPKEGHGDSPASHKTAVFRAVKDSIIEDRGRVAKELRENFLGCFKSLGAPLTEEKMKNFIEQLEGEKVTE
jgi:hypothetical protein